MLFRWMLTPLDEHIDFGLGATGQSFLQAAKQLADGPTAVPVLNGHLAINFLYRHASELFLKSMIVVLHRALDLPYGDRPAHGPPHLLKEGAWTPLERVHSLVALWEYVHSVLRQNAAAIANRCRTDWQAIPPALPDGITTIEAADASGTYFRYPSFRSPLGDRVKSPWKCTTAEAALEKLRESNTPGQPGKWFVACPGDTIQRVYQYDPTPLPEVTAALAEVADLLDGAVLGLRAELADGR